MIQTVRDSNPQIIKIQSGHTGSTKVFQMQSQNTITRWQIQMEERNYKASDIQILSLLPKSSPLSKVFCGSSWQKLFWCFLEFRALSDTPYRHNQKLEKEAMKKYHILCLVTRQLHNCIFTGPEMANFAWVTSLFTHLFLANSTHVAISYNRGAAKTTQ